MRIKHLFIKNLYNKSFSLHFNTDVTFLHGINGCGKTTILNIISSIIAGRLTELHNYNFDLLELECDDDNQETKLITVEKIGLPSGAGYKVVFGEASCVIPLIETINKSSQNDEMVYFIDREENEDKLRREEAATSQDISNFKALITKEFNPIYLPLSRKDSAASAVSDKFLIRRKPDFAKEKTNLDASVSHALELVGDFNSMITHLDNTVLERLKEEIVTKGLNTLEVTPSNLLSIDSYSAEVEQYLIDIKNAENDSIKGFTLPLETEIQELIVKIKSLSNSFSIKDNNNIVISSALEFANYVSATSQLRRVIEIISMINNVNRTRRERRQPITRLIKTINHFLQDGFKEVFIEQKRRSLRFRTVGTDESTSILAMSSGEKQIVIFFVYILLGLSESKKSGIFIIDEPELSLHVEWQNKFIPSIMGVAPYAQLVFATHSPEIIGGMTHKCTEVRGEQIV